MSRVYKRLTPAGKVRWWVCVTYRGQRHREVAGDSKKAALKRLRELEERRDKGKSAKPKKNDKTAHRWSTDIYDSVRAVCALLTRD